MPNVSDALPRSGTTKGQRTLERAAGTIRRLVHDRPAVISILESELGTVGFTHTMGNQSNSTISTNSLADLTARAALAGEGRHDWQVRQDIAETEKKLASLVEHLADLYATVPRAAVRIHLEKSRARCGAGLGLPGFEEWGNDGEECFELSIVTNKWAADHGGHVCTGHYNRWYAWDRNGTDGNVR
jgi:hypothetical protein